MASLESTHHYSRKYEVFTLTQTCEILMNNNLLLGNFHCITVVYRYVVTKIKVIYSENVELAVSKNCDRLFSLMAPF